MDEFVKEVLGDYESPVQNFYEGGFENYYFLGNVIFAEWERGYNIRAKNNVLLVSEIKKKKISSVENLLKLAAELNKIYIPREVSHYYLAQPCLTRAFTEFGIKYHFRADQFFEIEALSLKVLNHFTDSDWEVVDRICAWINTEIM